MSSGDDARRVGLHLFAPAGDLVMSMVRLRATAEDAFAAGVDLVSFGEHHGRTPGYLPDSWALASALLAVDPGRHIGMYPFLGGLRPAGIAMEQIEMGTALHPHRLTVAVAPGYAASDFAWCEVDEREARQRCWAVAERLAAEPVQADVLIAAAGPRAVARAARLGAGLLLPPLTVDAESDVIDRYIDAGGRGRIVVQRWLALDDSELSLYRDLASPWRPQPVACPDGAALASLLTEAFDNPAVCEVSLRVGGTEARALGSDVLALLADGCTSWRAGSMASHR